MLDADTGGVGGGGGGLAEDLSPPTACSIVQ